MRVMSITSNLRGSVGKIVHDIHEGLIRRGVETEIAWGRGSGLVSKGSFRFANSCDVLADGVKSRLFDSAGLNSKWATKRLLEEVERFAPSIVHLHCLHGYCLNYPMLLEYLHGKRTSVIWTHHDAWALTGHCAYFESAGCYKWQIGCDRCPQKSTYPRSLLLDRSKRNWLEKKSVYVRIANLTLVTPSYWLAEMIGDSMLKSHPVRVIRNGVDTGVFYPRVSDTKMRLGIDNKKLILGVSNTWEERKGLNDFLLLREKLSDEYAICLVGPANKALLADRGIIHIDQTESQEELAVLYSAADLFVNPTYDDNYPTTNIESIACGTPVISYPAGGSAESARMYGCVVERCSPDSLVAAVESLDSCSLAREVAQFDRSILSSDTMVEEYYRLYQEVENA